MDNLSLLQQLQATNNAGFKDIFSDYTDPLDAIGMANQGQGPTVMNASALGGGGDSLFGDLFSGQNFGSTMGGIAGLGQMLYGMNMGNQMMDENKRNNSLYRRIMNEQSQQRTNAINSWT